MMNNKLNFRELYDYLLFFKCVIEIYEYFTVNNKNFTNFKEFINCPSILTLIMKNIIFNLRMMLNLFLDLRNTNFDDEQTLNFKCFTVNNINFTNFKEFIHCLSPIGYNWP